MLLGVDIEGWANHQHHQQCTATEDEPADLSPAVPFYCSTTRDACGSGRTCDTVLHTEAAPNGHHHAALCHIQHHAVWQQPLHKVVVVDVQQVRCRDVGGLCGINALL